MLAGGARPGRPPPGDGKATGGLRSAAGSASGPAATNQRQTPAAPANQRPVTSESRAAKPRGPAWLSRAPRALIGGVWLGLSWLGTRLWCQSGPKRFGSRKKCAGRFGNRSASPQKFGQFSVSVPLTHFFFNCQFLPEQMKAISKSHDKITRF